ncbi:MAG: TrkH family potassium uptake protein [Saprospiraceae bacterium]
MLSFIKTLKPLQSLIYGYLFILILGFLLLCLPFFQVIPTAAIDNLFIATSAVSTTGLATVTVPENYNIGGQLVILLLIQVGGLGYMSIGSFIVLLRRKRLNHLNSDLIKYDFSLPDNFSVLSFIKNLIYFTLLIELLGAIGLSFIFHHAGESQPIWQGIFHSVSAFCTAGFSLFPDSFESYASNFYLNAVISILSIGGALGFIVFTDLFERFSGRKSRITFTSKIIIRFTFVGMLIGALVLFLSDENIMTFAPEKRILVAFFQSMTAFTTVGFNTYPIGAISAAPLFFIILLMAIGASPSGTGGGMKSTTITALYAQLKSTFNQDSEVLFMNCKIPSHRVRMATSKFFFYVIVICIGTYLLLLLHPEKPFEVLFEAVSALGTVGISTGLTGDLSNLSKFILIGMMFLGRIGPLSFGMALFGSTELGGEVQEEDVAI